MRYLVTGCAGFVGYHVTYRLLEKGHHVFGIDGMTEYYDPALKRARMARLLSSPNFEWSELMLEDRPALEAAVRASKAENIIHLAAQAGVRYSLEAPRTYLSSNIVGTFNLLETIKDVLPAHLLIASSSSVYGGNLEMPFRETHAADHPLSHYAATKRAVEVMSHSYAHLWRLPITNMRFFTVYGPWGRPDMALFRFVEAIRAGESIDVYGEGQMQRDFTYVDDIVEAILRLVDVVPGARRDVQEAGLDTLSPVAPWRVVNLCGGRPVGLRDFIVLVEKYLGQKAKLNLLPFQKGDPVSTWGDPSLLHALTGFTPTVELAEGVARFIEWSSRYPSNRGSAT
ncbi:MAG: GDP-mannose 4,6-dehydratase [Rhizobiaceae bacterium]|nr:GDP-mannose 4,6-dehydratase [Rhizobiaceae bacterium]